VMETMEKALKMFFDLGLSLKNFVQVYSYFWVWLGATAVGLANLIASAPNSTFQPHMKQIPESHLSDSAIGLYFLIGPGCYMVSGPFVGYISDNFVGGKSLLIMGMASCGVGYLLLGPTPFLIWIYNSLWTNSVAMLFIGIGVSMSIVPALSVMKSCLPESITMNDAKTNDTLSGVINAALALGSSAGPILASGLTEWIGFAWAVSVIAAFCGICVFVLFGACIYDIYYITAEPITQGSELLLGDTVGERLNPSVQAEGGTTNMKIFI